MICSIKGCRVATIGFLVFLGLFQAIYSASEVAKKPLIIYTLDNEGYQDCHIKGAINVPVDELKNYAKKLDKDQEIVVYCARYECPVSKQAYHILKDLGFTHVKAYEGGIVEWFQLGYPVEGICKRSGLHQRTVKKAPEKGIKTLTAQELKDLL